jgi:hypothetical protein
MPKDLDQVGVREFSKSDIQKGIKNAIETSRKFLEQYHSLVIYKSAYLDNKKWMVSMEVGWAKEDIIEVAIDVETGKILGCNHSQNQKR